jgi:chromosome segregation ATPase
VIEVTKSFTFLNAVLLSVVCASSVQAENRFASTVGGAVGGTGSIGEGSVTVHHNFLPSERQELDDQIGDVDARVAALEARVGSLEGQVATLNSQVANLNNAVTNANNRAQNALDRANSAHERITALSSRVSRLHEPPSGGEIIGDGNGGAAGDGAR